MPHCADQFGPWLIDLDSLCAQRNVRCCDVCAFSSDAGGFFPRMPAGGTTENVACGGGAGLGRMCVGMESIRVG
jgi:hypothetical protein